MNEFYPIMNFESRHSLSYPLAIIKSSIINCHEAFGGWFTYESEGYLEGIETIVLSIRVSVPNRSHYGIMNNEKIAISFFNGNRIQLSAFALRKNFPDLPHINLRPKDTPKSLCLFNVGFMEYMYNQTFIDFIQRVKNWLDRAANGELHLDEQPREPFLLDTYGDIVLDTDTYSRITRGESGFELFIKRYEMVNEKRTNRFYIEVGSNKYLNKNNPFAVLCIRSNPSADQCINYLPNNYYELADLIHNKLSINLDKEIYQFVKEKYRTKNEGGVTLLVKTFLLVLCIPRLDSKGELSIPEILVFQFEKKLMDITLSLGIIVKQLNNSGKMIYVRQNDFNKKTDELQNIKVAPFKVIKPFTEKLAMDMANIPDKISNLSFSVIGLGALGSQLVLNLARQGFSNWNLIDGDTLLPHNFSRHAVSARYSGRYKTVAVKDEIDWIFNGSKTKVYSHDFEGITNNIRKMFNTDIVLDCSASYSVLRHLAYSDEKPFPRTFCTYYCGRGYTSVLLCEDMKREIRIDDIDLQIKIKGIEDSNVQSIYKLHEDNNLIYSTSCNNTTSIMPQDLVAIHSGIISREVKMAMQSNKAKYFINIIEEEGYSIKAEEFIAEKVIVKNFNDWQFRINSNAISDMCRFRDIKIPNETGGILIGWINSFDKIIYIGKTIPAPPDSVERPYYFQRGNKGLFKLVKQIQNISNDDLRYVGEWHSHPNHSSVGQSLADKLCIEKISENMAEEGLPGVLIIIGDFKNIGCYLSFDSINDF